MLHLYIKILAGAEGVVFGGDFLVGDDDGEVLDGFLGVEDADDLVFLGGGQCRRSPKVHHLMVTC
jgi:hypothetical protein